MHPEYKWLPWKFDTVPHRFWEDINNVKRYVQWLGDQLNIKTMEDWYQVSYKVTHIRYR